MLNIDYKAIVKLVHETGGATFDKQGNIPASGYMVSLSGYERVIDRAEFGMYAIIEYLICNLKNIDREYVGIWIDGDKVYFDISVNLKNKQVAKACGQAWNQLAIYDVKYKKVINLK